MRLEELAQTWRLRAKELHSYAAEGAAVAYEQAAAELERAQSESADTVVSLNDGARISGYSPDHLGRLVKAGKIPNQGTTHRPRVRIADLPRKPKRLTS